MRGSASTTGSTTSRAALGIGQLEKLDAILALRREVAARYGELLAGVDGLELPLADDADHVRSWFVYVVTLAARHRPRARDRRARARRAIASSPLPAVDPPPGVHARALRLPRGTLPGLGGRSAADAGAAVLHARSSREDQERVVEALAARTRAEPTAAEIIARWRTAPQMVFLGFGKYARADRIYALEPITGDGRGGGAAGRASGSKASPSRSSPRAPSGRSCTTWGRRRRRARRCSTRRSRSPSGSPTTPSSGRVDLADLGRRARKLLEASSKPAEPSQLF